MNANIPNTIHHSSYSRLRSYVALCCCIWAWREFSARQKERGLHTVRHNKCAGMNFLPALKFFIIRFGADRHCRYHTANSRTFSLFYTAAASSTHRSQWGEGFITISVHMNMAIAELYIIVHTLESRKVSSRTRQAASPNSSNIMTPQGCTAWLKHVPLASGSFFVSSHPKAGMFACVLTTVGFYYLVLIIYEPETSDTFSYTHPPTIAGKWRRIYCSVLHNTHTHTHPFHCGIYHIGRDDLALLHWIACCCCFFFYRFIRWHASMALVQIHGWIWIFNWKRQLFQVLYLNFVPWLAQWKMLNLIYGFAMAYLLAGRPCASQHIDGGFDDRDDVLLWRHSTKPNLHSVRSNCTIGRYWSVRTWTE